MKFQLQILLINKKLKDHRTDIMDNTQEVDLGQLKPQLLLKQKVHTTMGSDMVIKQEVQEVRQQKL